MVTVSAISIILECLTDDSFHDEQFHMIPIFSSIFFMRLASFVIGGALYFALSWAMNVPEPEELLEETLGISHANESHLDDGDIEIQPFIENDRGQTSPSSRMKKGEHLDHMGVLQPPSPGNNGKNKTNGGGKAYNGVSAWSTGQDLQSKEQRKAWKVAMLLFISLLVHNFPEGLCVAASALESTNLGITVTIGIMIHNIPEGIAIAIPCLAARPDQPWLSFILASVSGLAEPAGAFVALLALKDVQSDSTALFSIENILGFVAGIMVTVAVKELFPEGWRHLANDKKHFWWGTIIGIILMVATELYLPE